MNLYSQAIGWLAGLLTRLHHGIVSENTHFEFPGFYKCSLDFLGSFFVSPSCQSFQSQVFKWQKYWTLPFCTEFPPVPEMTSKIQSDPFIGLRDFFLQMVLENTRFEYK